jgi:hypothetical protein
LQEATEETRIQVLEGILLEATMTPQKFVEREWETLSFKCMCLMEKTDDASFKLLLGIESMLLMWYFTHSKWGMKERMRAIQHVVQEVFGDRKDGTGPEIMRVLMYSFLNRIAVI